MRTAYVPYMADHGYTVVAALQRHGIGAEALPPPDDESLTIGLRLCRGRECLPCFLSVGDVIRKSREPGFDPDAAAVFLPGSPGPCRFGQYGSLLRDLLEREGLGGIEIVGPSAENGYRGFGADPTALRALVWQGFVAVDLLHDLVRRHRPYEREPGIVDETYHECLPRIVAAVRSGGGKRLVRAMREVALRFRGIPLEGPRRPVVGLVGEIFLMLNPHANQGIERRIEALGGEVASGGMREWMYYTNHRGRAIAALRRDWGEWGRVGATDLYQRRWERRVRRPVRALLPRERGFGIPRMMRALRPYYDPALGTEAVLTMAKAIALSRAGVSGILNVYPFACMPGIVSGAMAPVLRRDLGGIPWLDVPYAAQRETNLNTRLEAFVHQVLEFRRSRGAVQRAEAPFASGPRPSWPPGCTRGWDASGVEPRRGARASSREAPRAGPRSPGPPSRP